jgi:hypothetical protein
LSDLDEFKDRYRRSVEAFIQADPGPQKDLWSRRADVTLANPLGPPAKGLERVFTAMESAAAPIRDGEDLTFDVISSYETGELHGHEEARKGWSRWAEAWTQQRSEPEEIIELPDGRIFALTVQHLRGRDEVEAKQRSANILTFRNGNVLRWEVYWDPDTARTLVGLGQ